MIWFSCQPVICRLEVFPDRPISFDMNVRSGQFKPMSFLSDVWCLRKRTVQLLIVVYICQDDRREIYNLRGINIKNTTYHDIKTELDRIKIHVEYPIHPQKRPNLRDV